MIEKSADFYSKIYETQRKKIEEIISQLFTGKKPDSLYVPCSYIMKSGGKRLRPLLVLLSAKAVGGEFKKVYNAAVAVELLHNFTLVHDDIMDNADKRRGRLTLHKKYDLSTAILTGDNLIAIAYQSLLKDCKENDSPQQVVFETFTKGIIEVCEGQSLDKEFELKSDVTLEEYLLMINKKTAALAEMCCTLGAQLGKGSSAQIKALGNYGRNLGIAFQIQDDLLDITAEEAEFGKIIGGDLVEGKKTFLFIRALEKASREDKKDLLQVIENRGIGKKYIKKYKDLYCRLGVIDDAKNEIIRYTNLALKETKKIPPNEREMFIWLANTLIKRNK